MTIDKSPQMTRAVRTMVNARIGLDGRIIADWNGCDLHRSAVEMLGEECFRCAADREFQRAKSLHPDNPAFHMRKYWEW